MSDTPTPKVRFKLPGGEEFEAEGSAEFIEAQRDYFLQLLHRQPLSGAASTHEKLPFSDDNSVFLCIKKIVILRTKCDL